MFYLTALNKKLNWVQKIIGFIIQLSYTVRISVFWLADFTTWHWVVMKQPSWCHYRGVIAVVYIQHTSVITQWLRLSQCLTICQMQTLILLLMIQFLKTPRKQLLGVCLFWKVRLWFLNFSFKLVEVFLRVVNSLEKDVMLIKSLQKVILNFF